jgi:hypothetical protein
MRYADWQQGKAVLQDYAALSSLIGEDTYTAENGVLVVRLR